MRARNESIGIDAFFLAAYFALAPMHQTMVLSNGSTVVKYLAFAVMLACVAQGYLENKRFIVILDLVWPVMTMLGWFALSIIWSDSRSTTVSSLISTGSYCALVLIVGSRRWNRKEITLFLAVLILTSVYYAFQLLRASAIMKRATLSFALKEENSKEADQNVVALNVGFGALAAFQVFLKRKKGIIKWAALAAALSIMTGIVATGSRGGLFAFLAGIIYLVFKESKVDIQLRNSILLIAVGSVIAYWLIFELNILHNDFLISRFKNTDISSMSGRIEIWGQYLNTLFSRPVGFLCGYGFGCETVAHAAYMGRNWLRASHNDFISILCQAGIPGLLLTGSFILHIWRSARKQGHLLGCAYIILALIGSMDIDFFKAYGWWNAMILAYIGVDGSLAVTRNEPMPSLSFCHQGKQSRGRSAS